MIQSMRPAKPRKQIGPKHTEHADAVSFWKLVKYHEGRFPALKRLFAVANGGDRHPAVAAKLKAEGVRAGVADYIAIHPSGDWHGLALELKTLEGKTSREQKDFLAMARDAGYRAEVAHGWAEAWRITCEHFGIEVAK